MKHLKEPLLHFILLGAAIFFWFAYLNPEQMGSAEADQIIVDDQDVDRMIEQFELAWRRSPTLDELVALQDRLIQDELLVREALSLGLDQGDAVIRNRLTQKMNFLTTSIAQLVEPNEEELRRFLLENQALFQEPAVLALEQVSIGPGVDVDDIEAALDALNEGREVTILLGTSLLPTSFPQTGEAQIDGVFGRGFFGEIVSQPEGVWVGPISSAYGQHLVRINSRMTANVPPFKDIREEVLIEWQREKVSEMMDEQIDLLRSRYEVTSLSRAALSAKLEQ